MIPATISLALWMTAITASELAVSVEERPSSRLSLHVADGGFARASGVTGETSILRSSLIAIDHEVLKNLDPWQGPRVAILQTELELFSDLVVTAQLENPRPLWSRSETLDGRQTPSGFLVSGSLVGPTRGWITILSRPSLTYVNLYVEGVGDLRLRQIANDLYVAELVEHSAAMDCRVESIENIDGHALTSRAMASELLGSGTGCDDGLIIDLIMLFTPEAAVASETPCTAPHACNDDPMPIDDRILLSVADANQIFLNSAITTELRLVAIVETPFSEAEAGHINFTHPWIDGHEWVHSLRDSLRADLLCVVTAGSGVSGGGAHVPSKYTPAMEVGGPKIIAAQMTMDPPARVFIHEIGHALGCRHDYQTDCFEPIGTAPPCTSLLPNPCPFCEGPPSLFDFANGLWTVVDASADACFGTIMSGQPRAPHFSRPGIFWDYQGYGPYETGIEDCADCGRAIQEGDGIAPGGGRHLVSGYRTSHDTTDTVVTASADAWLNLIADGQCDRPSISNNGQDVAFASQATNFPGAPGLPMSNIWLFNRESGLVLLISTDHYTGDAANGASTSPAISGNRGTIVFTSAATNLLATTISGQHIYRYDREWSSSSKSIVSVDSVGVPGNGPSDRAAVSYDGEYVAFESDATNLVSQDTNGVTDVFVRKLSPSLHPCTTRVSVSSNGVQGNGVSTHSAISADGQFVAFQSEASNLVQGDANGYTDIFVHDRGTKLTTRVSVPNTPGESDGDSFAPSISADGSRIAFHSRATNLVTVPATIHNTDNVYVHDTTTGQTKLVSISADGLASGNRPSTSAQISPDGRYVAFASYASNLTADSSTTNRRKIYVHDMEFNDTFLVSRNDDGSLFDGDTNYPAIGNFGRFVAFEADVTDPTAPTQGVQIFVRDRGPHLLGDLNGDGVVSQADLDILLQNWGECLCCAADLNGDGWVDGDDYAILLANWDGTPPASCAGVCGGTSPDGCKCDEDCCIFEDCCDDKDLLCGACP